MIDRYHNAIAMSATIEGLFGSSRWAAGFLLNNEMTDFAREFDPGGKPLANAVGCPSYLLAWIDSIAFFP